MVESLSNNADKSDVDAEVEDHRATDVHDEPQPPEGKGEAGGVAELDDNGTVRSGQVPSLAVTDTFTVENESDLTGLSDAEIGDVGIVSSDSLTYILTGDYDVQDNWVEFETPPAPVDDVNGQTGSVDLGAGDVDAEPSGAVEDHRTEETHDTAQPPENHGNGAHNVTFAEDGDAQPPENHGNGAHTSNYLPESDYDPEADTHSRYTDGEAEAAAPVQSVNGDTGDVEVDVSPPITSKDSAETFEESDVTLSRSSTEVSGGSISLGEGESTTESGTIDEGESTTVNWTLSDPSTETVIEITGDTQGLTFSDFEVNGTLLDESVPDEGLQTYDISDETEPFDFSLTIESGSSFPRDWQFESATLAIEGEAIIGWDETRDVFRWDAATFQTSEDGGTVEVYIEESTDGGSTWTEIQGPISRGDPINADAGSEVRFRVDLSRNDTANNPTLDAIYRRWEV